MSEDFIYYENVTVQYSPFVLGLDNISLKILKGEFVFLIGPTGSGKSTLLKLLTREVQHTDGHVWLAGKLLDDWKEKNIPILRRNMGIVPQDCGLLPNKKVWENINYALRAIGVPRRTARKRVVEILEQVNIAHRADAYPSELSGGEQQRVSIGRALVNDPPLLIADEPTANLDPECSLDIMKILYNLNKLGTTVIVSTHEHHLLSVLKKRVINLSKGKIISDDIPSSSFEVFSKESYVYTGPN